MKYKTTTAMLILFVVAAWLVSCVDVPSNGPTPPEFNSEFRFVNAAKDLGSVTLTVDGQSQGTLDYMGATGHAVYPSGNRVAVLSNGDTLNVAMTTDQRATVVLLPKSGASREFAKLIERRTFDPSSTPTARVRLFHAATAGDIDVTVAGADTSVTKSLAFKDNSGYLNIPAGSYTISVFASGDTTAMATTTISATNIRQTTIIGGDASAGSVDLINLSDE